MQNIGERGWSKNQDGTLGDKEAVLLQKRAAQPAALMVVMLLPDKPQQ
jgi:hypothetical protein